MSVQKNTSCELCPLGFFQEATNATTCNRVDEGYKTPTSNEGATQQLECPPGMFSQGGATGCIDCPQGWYQGDYGKSQCDKCPPDEMTPEKGSRSCIAVQPSDIIKILTTEPVGSQVNVEWEAKDDIHNVNVSFSILSASNQTFSAVIRNLESTKDGKVSGRAVNLLYGRKYYFHISALNSNSTKVLSFPSESSVIECPPMACCGVETDDTKLCSFNLSYGVTAESMAAQTGAFRVKGTTFKACPEQGACLGGVSSECEKGHMGLLCHRCEAGFARSGVSKCSSCDARTVIFIIVGLLASAAICIYFIKTTLQASEKTVEIEMAKIGMSGLQALTVLGRYPLQWPPEVLAIFDTVGAAFSAAGEVVSFQCAMDDANRSRYLRGAAVVLGSPLLVILLVAVFWGILSARRGERKKTKSNFIVSVMVILFLVLPTLNQTAFRLFTCTEIMPGMLHVAGDLELPCYRGTHLAYVLGMAIPAFLVYAIGIPFTALYILYRMHKRKKLFASREESYSANVYKFLYGGYKRNAYYWETIIMFRKVSLNVVLVVMAPSPPLAQALTILLVLFLFLSLHVRTQPYSDDRLNRIEMSSLLLSTTVLYFGIYLFNEDVQRDIGTAITIGMISALSLSAIAFIIGLIRFSGNAHAADVAEALDTAKSKASHGMHALKEKASHGIEMAVVRIRSSKDGERNVNVNPVYSHNHD
eukprot:g1100.t1